VYRRINVIDAYLKAHLPEEHDVHLSLTMALTPEEYEQTEWVSSAPALTLVAS
jgi:hypothetical protein